MPKSPKNVQVSDNWKRFKTYGPDKIPASKNATNAPICATRKIQTKKNNIPKNIKIGNVIFPLQI